LPTWLVQFNQKRRADTFMNRNWEPLHPIHTYLNSTADHVPYEGKLPGERAPVFPHKTPVYANRGHYYGLRYTPSANTMALRAATACLTGEQLGSDRLAHFLSITLSPTHHAVHKCGPAAVDIEDIYPPLGRDLASPLSYLDKHVRR